MKMRVPLSKAENGARKDKIFILFPCEFVTDKKAVRSSEWGRCTLSLDFIVMGMEPNEPCKGSILEPVLFTWLAHSWQQNLSCSYQEMSTLSRCLHL